MRPQFLIQLLHETLQLRSPLRRSGWTRCPQGSNYLCPRSSSALAGDHQHLDEVLKSCAVGSVQGSGRGLVQVPMWRQSQSLQQTA